MECVYVLDVWGETPPPYRPWAHWFRNVVECTWKSGKLIIRDLNDQCASGVMVVHWSSVGDLHEDDEATYQSIMTICAERPALRLVVISAPPSMLNKPPTLFFRRTEVSHRIDDPFPSYLMEFVAQSTSSDRAPDPTLLEPEPHPAAVADLHVRMRRGAALPDQTDAIWIDAQTQVQRIFRRGDGILPYVTDHLELVLDPAWPVPAFGAKATRDMVIGVMQRALELHAVPRHFQR